MTNPNNEIPQRQTDDEARDLEDESTPVLPNESENEDDADADDEESDDDDEDDTGTRPPPDVDVR